MKINTLHKIKAWGKKNWYVKILIIKGIGYKSFYLLTDSNNRNKKLISKKLREHNDSMLCENALLAWNLVKKHEFIFNKYLVIRAGHTTDLVQPIPPNTFIKIKKKERKLIIFGTNKQLVNNLSKKLYEYRPPSAYTGRGIKKNIPK